MDDWLRRIDFYLRAPRLPVSVCWRHPVGILGVTNGRLDGRCWWCDAELEVHLGLGRRLGSRLGLRPELRPRLGLGRRWSLHLRLELGRRRLSSTWRGDG